MYIYSKSAYKNKGLFLCIFLPRKVKHKIHNRAQKSRKLDHTNIKSSCCSEQKQAKSPQTPNSETSCHASKARPTPPTFATRANHQPANAQVESDTRSNARKPKIPSEHSTQATIMRATSMSSSTSAGPHWPVLGPQPPTSGAVHLAPLKSAVPAPTSASSDSTTAVSSTSSSYYSSSSSSSSSAASSPTRWKKARKAATASNTGTVPVRRRSDQDDNESLREKKLLKLALANSLVETKWMRAKPLPHARVFRPTLDEFADPIQYIARYVLVVLCAVLYPLLSVTDDASCALNATGSSERLK